VANDLPKFDPKLDLKLERVIDVPPELVWEAWTTPEHLKEWFCPRPWRVTEAEIDLRPGGKFRTLMCGPAGEKHDNVGCYLEVVPNRKLVWTDALVEGYRPAAKPFMTAMLLLAPEGSGTRYTAIAMHVDESTRKRHQDMGFEAGWGTVLDQLVEMLKAR
jgi:uncharacterized protein YndB with AHSA1/START domain